MGFFCINIFMASSQILNFNSVRFSTLYQHVSICPPNHGIFAVCTIIWLCFKLVFLWLVPPQLSSNFPHAVLKVLAWKGAFTCWKQPSSLSEIHKSCLIMMTHTMTVQGSPPYFSIRMYFWLFVHSTPTMVSSLTSRFHFGSVPPFCATGNHPSASASWKPLLCNRDPKHDTISSGTSSTLSLIPTAKPERAKHWRQRKKWRTVWERQNHSSAWQARGKNHDKEKVTSDDRDEEVH